MCVQLDRKTSALKGLLSEATSFELSMLEYMLGFQVEQVTSEAPMDVSGDELAAASSSGASTAIASTRATSGSSASGSGSGSGDRRTVISVSVSGSVLDMPPSALAGMFGGGGGAGGGLNPLLASPGLALSGISLGGASALIGCTDVTPSRIRGGLIPFDFRLCIYL